MADISQIKLPNNTVLDIKDAVARNGLDSKADKADTILDTTLSRGRLSGSTVGAASFAFGADVTASGQNSHAEGYGTTASNPNAHAEGGTTTASGINSHAEGAGTTADGQNSHAEGSGTTASGSCAHAEGGGTTASSTSSHAEGGGSRAIGDYSHAEGGGTTASGPSSHAEGGNTTASGDFSHAEGCGTIANHKSQHVFGEYNAEDPSVQASSNYGNFLEIVGNGANDLTRSNARTLDWSGNERLAGMLYVNADQDGTGGTAVLTTHQDISGKANLASPTFTGIPAAPTADNGTNTTQIATTAFVQNAISAIPAASTSTLGLVKVGTNLSIDANGVLSSTDTNTHRPIQVKGTQILGNNTTALNFAEGDNITITNSSGTITISATDTNTKNTAGSTNTSSKIFLIGAKSQGDNPQTYSHDTAYVGTDGCLYSGGTKVLTAHQSLDGCVQTSGTQTASGTKTWTGSCLIQNSAESPAIQFRSTPQTSSTGIIYYMGTSDSDASTDYTQGRFYFYEYSPASNGKSRTSYYERYRLPAVDKARTGNATYDILTTNGPAFLQLKEYSYAYTVAGNSSLEITNTNFGHSSPSGYTPVALVRYNTGSTQVTVPHVGINIASNTIALVVQNTKSSSVSATAKIAILYARTTAIV